MQFINGGVTAPKGFKASGIHCGIRKNKTKKDLALILCEKECDAAAVYTQNLVYGAPITVTRNNIADGKAYGVICNSGIANTCNADGVEQAEMMCQIVADATNLKPTDFVVASTGVIGQPIDIEPIEKGMAQLVNEETDVPVVVGFDGSNIADAVAISEVPDGIVLENAIVNLVAKHGKDAIPYVAEFVKELKKGMLG